jgi:hypothetical protein
MFMLEVQAKLTEAHFACFFLGNRLIVPLGASHTCEIRVSGSYWQLSFSPLVFSEAGSRIKLRFSGSIFGHSSAHSVCESVRAMHSWRQVLSIFASELDADGDEIHLQLFSHRMIVTLFNFPSYLGFDERKQIVYFKHSFRNRAAFDLQIPSAGACGTQIRRAMLSGSQMLDLGNFLLSTAYSVFRLMQAFASAPNWTVVGCPGRFFHIVYRRRFTARVHLRGARLLQFLIAPLYPHCCLFASLGDLEFGLPVTGPPRKTLFVSVDVLEQARDRLALTADLILLLEEKGFEHQWDIEQVPAIMRRPSVFRHRRSPGVVRAVVQGPQVSFELEGDEYHSGCLAELSREAQNAMEYALAVTDLLNAFLSFDANLFKLVLVVFGRMKSELRFNLAVIFTAMQTGTIKDDGTAAVTVFIDGKSVEIDFRAPFGLHGPISIKRNVQPEPVKGIAGLFDALQPSLFDGGRRNPSMSLM